MRYYLDTCIWIDFLEDRKGYNGEHIDSFAYKLFSIIIFKNHKLIISDLLIKELSMIYSLSEIDNLLKFFEGNIELISSNDKQKAEAILLVQKLKVPYGDALHAILSRDNNLILVTRDNHFIKLREICNFTKPENLFLG